MSSHLTNEDYLTFVREHEDDIVSGLLKINPEQFCRKITQKANISYSVFNSFDLKNTEAQLLVRYMLRTFCEKLKSDSITWDDFLQVIISLDEDTTKLTEYLKCIELCKPKIETRNSNLTNAVSGNSIEHDITFNTEDISSHAEMLVSASSKWELIATSLNLKDHEIEDCRTQSNTKLSMCKVIRCWLTNHSNTTLKTLVTTLSSELVGETNLSLSVEKQIKEAAKPIESFHIAFEGGPLITKELATSQSDPVITNISITTIQISEGMSTILFIQASPKEFVTYQWKKNGIALEEGGNYSGVHSDMLVVSQACKAVEGVYTCCAKIHQKEVLSEKIALTVDYPIGRKKLLDLYAIQKEIPNSQESWPPVVCKEFINLALITSCEDSKYQVDITVRGDVDDIIAKKEKVEYHDVFHEYKNRELIIIEGRPGSGKTTLVHKIVKDWANGKSLLGAKLAFLIILRENNNKENKSLKNVLQVLYFDDQELQDVHQQILESNGENVVFVLDGLDEYKALNRKNDVVFQLLDKILLPPAMIIVSTRPSASNSIRKDAVLKRIEIVGFSEKEIVEYIDNFPFSTSSSPSSIQDSLKKYLHAHPNIMDMCYLPVHTAMICYLYAEKQLSSLFTQTHIYKEFTSSSILRQGQRKHPGMKLKSLEDLVGEYRDNFKAICKLAYYMTINSDQIITLEDMKAYLSHNEILQESDCLGLITVYNQIQSTGKTEMFSFLHLTLQEFLAAYYISHQSSSNQLKIYKKYSEYVHMEKVWSFCCGLESFQPSMKQFKKVFVTNKSLLGLESHRKKRIQYAFESQDKEVCNTLTRLLDCKFNFWYSILTPTDMVALGYVLCNTSLPVTEIRIGEQHYDDNRINILLEKICEKSFHELKRLDIGSRIYKNGIDSIIHLLKLCRSLEQINFSLRDFSIEQSELLADNLLSLHQLSVIELSLSFSPCSIETFIQKLSNLSSSIKLELAFEDITAKGAQGLARNLTVCSHTNISCLAFVNTSVRHEESNPDSSSELVNSDHVPVGTNQSVHTIGSEGAVSLSGSFQYLTNLSELDLSHNNIGSEGAVSSSGSFQYLTNLRELDLSHNNIGSEGAVSLSGSFQYLTKLRKLDLSHNNIGSETGSFQYLTKLWILNLSHNNIGSEGAVSLSGSFQYLTKLCKLDLSHNNIGSETGSFQYLTKLWILNLSHNNIGSEGTVSLSGSLQYLTNLWQLNLSHNSIPSEGAVSLSGSLKYLTKLLVLYFSHNSIGSEGAASLSGLFQHLAELQYFDLSYNNIGSEGIQSLANELSHLTNLRWFNIAHNNIDLKGALLLLSNLKKCNELSGAVINTTELDYNKLRGIVVQDIVTSDNATAIEELKAASKNKKEERLLDLGFTVVDIPPAKNILWQFFKQS